MKTTGKMKAAVTIAALAASLSLLAGPALAAPGGERRGGGGETTTPIRHLVVIFQENVSFDHYFGTYPFAVNPPEEPRFEARDDTPSVNGLGALINGELGGVLLTNNPNANNPANGANAINPFRLDRSQASTCDQNHNYGAEQLAFDAGLMDDFPGSVGNGESSFCAAAFAYGKDKGLVMGYFDGNTVTALWNYAQRFAINDNSYGTTFGPSTPGATNLIAGNTFPAVATGSTPKVVALNTMSQGTLVGDLDPSGDDCSKGITVQLGGKNIGDLLNAEQVSWGAFMGGFDLNRVNHDGSTGCARQSPASPSNGGPTADYIAHHAWFQYYESTANPHHVRPTVPPALFGTAADTKTNHQYDIHDFFEALEADNLPAVNFLKAPAFEDGHAGYSDPLLEQQFLVRTVNALQKSKFWESTAVVIAYDDSDGWYDHQMSPIINPSAVTNPANQSQNGDNLNGTGLCGHGTPLKDDDGNPIQGRCGYGPRMPLVVISPWARENYVDHTLTDQSSILRFIELNWETGPIGGGSFDADAGPLNQMFDFDNHAFGGRRLFLNPGNGEPL